MYNVRKGWPSNAAIDEVLKADTGAVISDGMIVTVTDGKIKPASFPAAAQATDPMCACVIEVDNAHYAADTYAANDALTAKDGKFAKASAGEKVLGRVLQYDATSGLMRVMWHEAR